MALSMVNFSFEHQLLHETEEVFEMIVRNFQEITETLPRIWVYVEVLGQPKSLVQPCQEGGDFLADKRFGVAYDR